MDATERMRSDNERDMPSELGEVTYLPPQAGETLWVLGQRITFKELGEAHTIFEGMDLPGGPPPHIHHAQDEAFYVIDGEYEFLCNDHVITVGPGSFVHIPSGTTHTLRNIGTSPGRTLVILTPPGPLERFFREVGEPATETEGPSNNPPDLAALLVSAERNQMEFVLPEGQ